MEPRFAIGQRALPITHPEGNVLWDCIPLPTSTIRRIVSVVEPFEFERIYGAWWGKIVTTDAKAAVHRSADRYIRALGESL